MIIISNAYEVHFDDPYKKYELAEYTHPLYIARYLLKFRCPYTLNLNPYLGCEHDCVYCFAQSLQESKHSDFNVVRPSRFSRFKNDFESAIKGKHQDKISRVLQKRVPIKMGTMTDAFQPLEKVFRLSRDMLKVLNTHKYPVIVNTKSTMVAEEPYIDLLASFPSIVQFSICVLDEDLAKRLEPNVPSPQERLEAMKKLSDRGIITQLRMAPFIPMITSNEENLTKLISAASSAGAKDVYSHYFFLKKSKGFRDKMNQALGFDYLEMLQKKEYIQKDILDSMPSREQYIKETRMVKKICDIYGLGYYPALERYEPAEEFKPKPGMSCCNYEKYEGFENKMDWTLVIRGHKIKYHTTFQEYIHGVDCPYSADFLRKWNSGKLHRSIPGIEFNPNDKTYSRISNINSGE